MFILYFLHNLPSLHDLPYYMYFFIDDTLDIHIDKVTKLYASYEKGPAAIMVVKKTVEQNIMD